jgi:hypothetical protein
MAQEGKNAKSPISAVPAPVIRKNGRKVREKNP